MTGGAAHQWEMRRASAARLQPVTTLELLGGFVPRRADGEALPAPPRKAQALLAVLAVRPGQLHPRDRLASLLWSRPDPQARADLRQTLHRLERTLPGAVRASAVGLALNPDRVDVDVPRFEALVAEGTPAALQAAAVLYRGDLLAGTRVGEDAFEEWLLPERERLRELAMEALARLLAYQREAGADEAAIQTGLRLLALDPAAEPVHRALMRLYAGQGRRCAALRQYRLCVDVIRRDLGEEPEAETTELFREIRGRPAR